MKRYGYQTQCTPCQRQRCLTYNNTPIRDLVTLSPSYNADIEIAKELLNSLGYNIQGDVHAQFMERHRGRFSRS